MSVQNVTTLHEGVLVRECIEGLDVRPGGTYVDLTGGGGGHATAIWQALDGKGTLLVLDQDEEAVRRLVDRFEKDGIAARVLHANFSKASVVLAPWQGAIDGMIADLGLSSDQLASGERGFSFNKPGPLDMRMDKRAEVTAADIVNTWDEEGLADIFFKDGEERQSRRIARAIAEARRLKPFETTDELAQLVAGVYGGRYRAHSRRHPATRVFQALRIAVNAELVALERLLQDAPTLLRRGGRLAVISFHSLEDRRVKWAFKEAPWQALTRKPILPTDEECEKNPRSRSAKLRVAKRREDL